MKNLFQSIVHGGEEQVLFKCGVTGENGRLTDDGLNLFVDLMFKGGSPSEARKQIIEASKLELKSNKQ